MIVSELIGGMGNQMFQYAIGKHLAIKNKTDLYLDTHFLLDRTHRENFSYRDYDLSIFNINAKIVDESISKKYGYTDNRIKRGLRRFINPGQLKYIADRNFSFTPSILNSPNNSYLNGYWQSEKYFTNIEDVIRSDFSFKNKIGSATDELVQKINGCNSVCLHVRRGDFLMNKTHGTTGIEYYSTAEKIILQKISNPTFFVFSDEIDWCKKNIKLLSETHFIDKELAGEKSRDHFELMTICKNFVIPNSSFGWWAAWLSKNKEKIVIAPRIWFHNSWNTKDLIPNSWIKI